MSGLRAEHGHREGGYYVSHTQTGIHSRRRGCDDSWPTNAKGPINLQDIQSQSEDWRIAAHLWGGWGMILSKVVRRSNRRGILSPDWEGQVTLWLLLGQSENATERWRGQAKQHGLWMRLGDGNKNLTAYKEQYCRNHNFKSLIKNSWWSKRIWQEWNRVTFRSAKLKWIRAIDCSDEHCATAWSRESLKKKWIQYLNQQKESQSTTLRPPE